jgi:HAL2 family 3'(2'),5'-bisphosphate nucleotidase
LFARRRRFDNCQAYPIPYRHTAARAMFATTAAACPAQYPLRRAPSSCRRGRRADSRARRGVALSASPEPRVLAHPMSFPPEMRTAVEAVQLASRLCMATQDILVGDDRAAKSDDSPVTVADFAAQALVGLWLERSHPDIKLVAEENADALRVAEGASLSSRVTSLVNETLASAMEDGFIESGSIEIPVTDTFVWDAIDRGAGSPSGDGAFWILDPIDGTKGFIAGRQYAVALGLMVNGSVCGGVLGCPNMPQDVIPEDATFIPPQRPGTVFAAYEGNGCVAFPTDERDALLRSDANVTPIRADSFASPQTARYMESWGDSVVANGDKTSVIAKALGITRTAVRVDSMAKYGALARGDAHLYLRFPPKEYREKVWDHAAGVAVVSAAGGVITDGEGNVLDFTKGRFLDQKGGIVASANPSLHAALLEALAKIDE